MIFTLIEFFIISGFFIFFVYLILKTQNWSLILLLIFISIILNYSLGFEIANFPVTTQKATIGVSLFIFFIFMCVNKIPINSIITSISTILFLMFLSLIISSTRAIDVTSSYKRIISFTLIIITIHLISFLIKAIDDKSFESIMFLKLPTIFSLLMGFAIYQFVTKGLLTERMTGTFENPNEFGGMVLMFLPLTLTTMQSNKWKYKIIGIITVILSLASIYFTYSRGTYLATIFFFLILSIGEVLRKKEKGPKDYKSIIGLFLLLIMLFFIVYYFMPENLFGFGLKRSQSIFKNGTLNLYDGSIKLRYNAVFIALRIFKNNMVLGVGPGNFIVHPFATSATENTYFLILVELGILGLFIFLTLLFKVFIILLENFWKLSNNKFLILNRYLLYGFITFLFLMGTNDFLYDIQTFWIWVAVIISLSNISTNKRSYFNEKS